MAGMAWDPNDPTDTSELEPDDYPAFIEHVLNLGKRHPDAIELLLDFFLNGVVFSFHPLAMNAWILGRVEMAQAKGFAWDQLLTLSPTQRQAMQHAAHDGFTYLKRATDTFREALRQVLVPGIARYTNPADLAEMLAETYTEPLPGLRMPFAQYCELVTRTETAKLHTLGRIDYLREQGDLYCVVTPHVGSCIHCCRLIEGRVFQLDTLEANVYANYGKPARDWVASVPQHPNCRHSIQPLLGREEDEMRAWMTEQGITDATFPAEGYLLSTGGLVGKWGGEYKANGGHVQFDYGGFIRSPIEAQQTWEESQRLHKAPRKRKPDPRQLPIDWDEASVNRDAEGQFATHESRAADQVDAERAEIDRDIERPPLTAPVLLDDWQEDLRAFDAMIEARDPAAQQIWDQIWSLVPPDAATAAQGAIVAWNSVKSDSEVQAAQRVAWEAYLAGGTAGNEFDRAMATLHQSRRQRWERLSELTGIPVPDAFVLYRGVQGPSHVAAIIKAWHKDEPAIRAAAHSLSSWSVDPAIGHRFMGLMNTSIGAIYTADVPFANTLADKWCDDASMAGTYRDEREVIVCTEPDTGIMVDPKRCVVQIDGQVYAYEDRDEAFAHYQRRLARSFGDL